MRFVVLVLVFTIFVVCGRIQAQTTMHTFNRIGIESRESDGSGFTQLKTPQKSWIAESRTECIRGCSDTNNGGCKAVEYDQRSGHCTFGMALNTNGSTLAHSQISYYRKLKTCNVDAGFIKAMEQGEEACIFVSDDKANRDGAAELCKQMDASLYIVNSMQRFTILNRYRKKTDDNVWVGLKDATGNNDFYWENGEKFEPSSDLWAPLWNADYLQPDANPGQLCVTSHNFNSRFHDTPCSYVERYACEMTDLEA